MATAITCLVLAAALALMSPARAQGTDGAAIRGGIDLLDRADGRIHVAGWVASTGPTPPTVHVMVDGVLLEPIRPNAVRYDLLRVIPATDRAWGWELRTGFEAESSLCVSASSDGAGYPIGDCWSRNATTMLPAVPEPGIVGAEGPLIRYSVEVEAATDTHPETLSSTVRRVLADARSWAANGDGRFEQVDPDDADLQIVLATPATTDRLCFPFLTGGQLSCNRSDEIIVFNINRWNGAVAHWSAPLAEYRAYLINHEIGHSLDRRHVDCPGAGQLAPLMLQQTKSLGGCRPNGWPHPDRATVCLGEQATLAVVPGHTLVGTDADDVIVGTPGEDDIRGGTGDDTICGFGGSDEIRGNAGADTLSGGGSADTIRGGAGADTIWGNGGADELWGNSGADVIRGGRGPDTIWGGTGPDTCFGGPATDTRTNC